MRIIFYAVIEYCCFSTFSRMSRKIYSPVKNISGSWYVFMNMFIYLNKSLAKQAKDMICHFDQREKSNKIKEA